LHNFKQRSSTLAIVTLEFFSVVCFSLFNFLEHDVQLSVSILQEDIPLTVDVTYTTTTPESRVDVQ